MKYSAVFALSALVAMPAFAERFDMKPPVVEAGDETKAVDVRPGKLPTALSQDPILRLDFSNAYVETSDIVEGGVVIDEIPTLYEPKTLSVPEVESMHIYDDEEYMLAIMINGEPRAYPLRIMNWHQGVNDVLGGQNIYVGWDPLSGHAYGFDRTLTNRDVSTFGISGLVYKSTSVLYDRITKSLWVPMLNKAVTGKEGGNRLVQYPVYVTQWKYFKANYANGTVLDVEQTGYRRDYRRNPYGSYGSSDYLLYPVGYDAAKFHPKKYVMGLRLFKHDRTFAVAFDMDELLAKKGKISLTFNKEKYAGILGYPVEIDYSGGHFEVTSPDPDVRVEHFYTYWFAWQHLNPNTKVVKQLP